MATFTTVIIDVNRPNVHAIAQSSGSGTVYMLAVVSAIANDTATTANDHRIYKYDSSGNAWSLLENIISSGTGSDRLNYVGLDASSNSMFPSVAISATGQYQSIAGKGDKLIWYSMDYGATWTLTTADESTAWPSQTGYMFKYTGGAVPVLTGNTGVTVWASNHFTATTGKTAYILNNTNNAIYDSTNSNATHGKDYTYAMADLPNISNPASPNKVMVMNNGKVYSYIHTVWGYANAGYTVEITSKPSFINNNYPRSSTINYCGGVALSADASYCAIARYTTTGGLWVIRNRDMINNDFSYIGNYNVNVVAVSRTGQYMVAGPNTSGTFYFSSDYGNNWTTNTLTFTGKLYNLFISDDGKRIVGAGGIAEGSKIFSTTGYIQYNAPMTAAEQRAAGKPVAELITLLYSYSDIMGAGYTLSQLIDGGIPLTNLLTVYSVSQLLAAGVQFSQLVNYVQWLDLSATSNIFNRSYVNNFVDLSGDMIIRNDGALIGGGDISFNNITVAGSTTFAGDTTLKSRLFIGNDISVNGNLYVGGDLSVNGTFSGNFANNVIPPSAIIDYPISSNVEITGNVRVAGDASFNGTRVDLSTNTILQVSGNITFTDGTTLSTYVDDISSGSFAQGNVIFKAATFAAVTCTGPVTAGFTATPSDYRLKTNVTDLNHSYSVDKLEPIQYDNILSNKHEFGLIAHELQAVYPELVKGEKDGAEYQRVNYNGLIGVLVKEVQEIKRQIEDLYKK